ncbi:hypothetical protein FBQ82_00035 [Anaerolineae bacterium CFX7]|nr:hypothetical protein [Anaerolineae bacterium CFX7]
MPKQIKQSYTPDIEQDAAVLLADIENAITAVAPFLPPTDGASNPLLDEFVGLCLQMQTAPREDVKIALRQMQTLLESLPLPVLIQNSDSLTIRTLLQIALDTPNPTPRLRCGALGYLYLERSGSNGKEERTSEVQGELLAFFLMQPRRPWTDEQIFDALWSGKDHQRAQWAFHSARKRLHDFAGEEVILKLKRGQYSLNPDVPIWFDVEEFEKLVTRAHTIPNATARIKLLERAVELYRGDLLEKNYKDWTVPIRTRLREKYIGALLQLGELTEPESPAQTIGWYEKALHADDLNEDAWLKLIRLHAQSENLISAHRTLVLCLDTFQREMGAQPSETFFSQVHSLIGDSTLIKSAKET